MTAPVLQLDAVSRSYPDGDGVVHALRIDGVALRYGAAARSARLRDQSASSSRTGTS